MTNAENVVVTMDPRILRASNRGNIHILSF